ncbi:MAG TPA: hypothetical protein PKN13_04665 [Accumulibacter sp.]|nr:protein YgfX [Accumulibacter sp.]HMW17008.1 hypothetical protein [Accumulibacter sp.]HMY07948.1 hypothetical protein [Accumulibacter sp.]HNC17260.1 hypothetical protein [Accumulibacter sp.]HND79846.1 hypothetical protein [Accumulibacter sp.]
MHLPIRIALRRSRILVGVLCGVHALSVISVVVLPWSWGIRAALLMLVLVSLLRSLKPIRLSGLRLGERGQLALVYAQGDPVDVSVSPDTAVFSRLIVLRVHDQTRMISQPLFPDSMSADEFRRLRLWLRWQIMPRESTDVAA